MLVAHWRVKHKEGNEGGGRKSTRANFKLREEPGRRVHGQLVEEVRSVPEPDEVVIGHGPCLVGSIRKVLHLIIINSCLVRGV